MNTSSLRQRLRKIREAHTPLQQSLKAESTAQHFEKWAAQRPAENIASYLTHTGELPTHAINQAVWKQGHRLFVPMLYHTPPQSLRFQPYNVGTPTRDNKYGIAEPAQDEKYSRPAREMGTILMPLLGFDTKGNRLGMGGGYYDRTLEFILDHAFGQPRPFLLGLAYDAQEVKALDRNPWDVPLDAVLTESGIRFF